MESVVEPSKMNFILFAGCSFAIWGICFVLIKCILQKTKEISNFDGLSAIFCAITSLGALAAISFLSAVHFTNEVTYFEASLLGAVFQIMMFLCGRASYRFMMKCDGRLSELQKEVVPVLKKQEEVVQVNSNPAMAS